MKASSVTMLKEIMVLFQRIVQNEESMNSENISTEVPVQVLPLFKEKRLTKSEKDGIVQKIRSNRLNQIRK